MLTTDLMMPLLVCVGPVVLALVLMMVHRFFDRTGEVTSEAVLDDGMQQVFELKPQRDEARWCRAYSQAALYLPK